MDESGSFLFYPDIVLPALVWLHCKSAILQLSNCGSSQDWSTVSNGEVDYAATNIYGHWFVSVLDNKPRISSFPYA